tara:strand:+ start:387 stop:1007 length:621 start_codon:yes stop_codon:yes gene_type:complete
LNIIAIESASTVCGAALFLNGNLEGINEIDQPRIHGEKLPLMVQDLMQSRSITVKELEGIAISSGPGSYTGLRIGMSLAKGLAATGDLPLIPVPTLLGMQFNLQYEGAIWVILHSHKNMVFAQKFMNNASCSDIVSTEFDKKKFEPLAGFNLGKLCVEDEYIQAPPSSESIGKLAILNFENWANTNINEVIPNYVTNINLGRTQSS